MYIERNTADNSFTFSFDEDDKKMSWDKCEMLILKIKQNVPIPQRSYDPSSNGWTIDDSWIDEFENWRKEIFNDVSQRGLF